MGTARWLFFRQTRLALVLGILMFVGYSSFCESFIRLWMFQPETFSLASVHLAAQVMAILSFSKLLLLFSYGSTSILSASGHIRFASKMTVVESFTNLLLSITFVVFFDLGLVGVALGTLVARLLTSTAVMPWYACRKTGINFWRYLIDIGGRGTVTGLLFAVICYGLQRQMPAGNWMEFSLQVFVATLGYLPIAFLLLIPAKDRGLVRMKLCSLIVKT
jgi:O-antigen/teichoic acid export membrane protein